MRFGDSCHRCARNGVELRWENWRRLQKFAGGGRDVAVSSRRLSLLFFVCRGGAALLHWIRINLAKLANGKNIAPARISFQQLAVQQLEHFVGFRTKFILGYLR